MTDQVNIVVEAGMRGAAGAAGPQGPAGAPGAAGRGFNPRGAWLAVTSYAVDDIYTQGGSTYRVTTAYTSGSSFGATDTTNAELWANVGAQGPEGPQGPQGQGVDAPYIFKPETYGALGDGTTDDTAAIQAAINAAFAYALAHNFYAEVVFQPKIYAVNGPYVQTGSGNSQLYIPLQPMASNKVTLVLRGSQDASGLPIWSQTVPQRSGTVLKSGGAGGTVNSTYGMFAVLGGPSTQQGYGDFNNGNLWNNVLIHLDGISVVVPAPANQIGIDLRCMAEATIGTASVFANATPGTPYPVPTNADAYGLAMPLSYNNDNSEIGNYSCEGMYIGLGLGEHTVVKNCRIVYCGYGIMVTSIAHTALVVAASIESCITAVEFNGGLADFLFLDLEDGSVPWAPFIYIRDSPGGGNGRVHYHSLFGYTSLIPATGVTTSPGVKVYDERQPTGYRSDAPAVPATATALRNPFFRDAAVTITGGNVPVVLVDGHALGATLSAGQSVTVFVPTGKTIQLNYTTAPSWEWILL